MQVDIHCTVLGGGNIAMLAIRLPRFEDAAKVIWAMKDERGWNWPGAAVRLKGMP